MSDPTTHPPFAHAAARQSGWVQRLKTLQTPQGGSAEFLLLALGHQTHAQRGQRMDKDYHDTPTTHYTITKGDLKALVASLEGERDTAGARYVLVTDTPLAGEDDGITRFARLEIHTQQSAQRYLGLAGRGNSEGGACKTQGGWAISLNHQNLEPVLGAMTTGKKFSDLLRVAAGAEMAQKYDQEKEERGRAGIAAMYAALGRSVPPRGDTIPRPTH